jgi:hypothetical protein
MRWAERLETPGRRWCVVTDEDSRAGVATRGAVSREEFPIELPLLSEFILKVRGGGGR